MQMHANVEYWTLTAASEMTYIVSSGALNSTHSLSRNTVLQSETTSAEVYL